MDKEVKNPTPVVQYQPKMKQKSMFMGFEFALAVSGIVIGSYIAVQLAFYVFALWTGTAAATPVFSQAGDAPVYGIAAQALFGVILAVFPIVFFPRFKRALADRPKFTSRLAYRLPLYVAFAIAFFAAVYLAAHFAAILISSLLLIGVDSVNIGELYLQQFLPVTIALGFVGFVGYLLLNIIRGKDTSKLASWVVFGVVVGLTFAALLTSTIKAHQSNWNNDYSNSSDSSQLQQRLKDLYRN